MKNLGFTILFLIGPFGSLISKNGIGPVNFLQESPYFFIENKGQVADQNHSLRPDVLFSGTKGGMVFHLRNNGISYQLHEVNEWKDEYIRSAWPQKIAVKTTIHRVDINWLNSNRDFTIEKGKASSDNTNYYFPHCSEGIFDVKSFDAVTYKNIYHGINLKWYEKNGSLKYDYIVSSGADANQIQIEIKGAKHLSINKHGELLIETGLGTIIEKAPLAYQQNKIIKTAWQLKDNVVSFKVGKYKKSLPLIIDPLVRIWGSYYGGTLTDYCYGLSSDAAGNSYTGGFTQSNAGTIMATSGSHQSTYGGGTNDAFLVKFNVTGVRQWATYFGGSFLDVITGITTDASGNIFASGYTDSGNGISTAGSHQATIGGSVDGFLAKFNTSGVRQWSTYYGGTANDFGYGCATNAAGDVFLCGYTGSTGGTEIATSTGFQSTHGGSTLDAFLVKFNTNGSRQWGTYYGGNGADYCYNCCIDNSGNCYIAGKSSSSNSVAISTPGSHQPSLGSGNDAYIAKFDTSGNRLWGTYYGSFGDETGYSCTTDFMDNVFLSGATDSYQGTIIATANGHQPAIGGGFGDAYLVKFDNTGVRQWGTYYGGVNYEEGQSCTTDPAGNVFMTGQTSSQTGTIMASTGSYQDVFGGGSNDAYIVKINPSGIREWGTYYGGPGDDHGVVLRADINYNIFLVGKTSTNTGTAIASSGGHQTSNGGGNFDGYIVKFFECPVVAIDLVVLNHVTCFGDSDGSIMALVSGGSSFTFSWSPGGMTTQTITGLQGGVYTCVVTNTCGVVDTESITVYEPPVVVINPASSHSILCNGSTATISANAGGGVGGYTYTWSTGSTGSAIAVSPTVNTVYTVTVADMNNCTAGTTYTQNVASCVGVNQNHFTDLHILISPNPGTGLFTVYGADGNNLRVKVYNSIGQLLLSHDLEKDKEINLSGRPNGIYYFRIEENGAPVFTTRVIKD